MLVLLIVFMITMPVLTHSIQISLITSDPTAPINPVASIELDDVDAAYKIAQDNGWEIVHGLAVEEWGVRRFFVRDADGNVVNLLSHVG